MPWTRTSLRLRDFSRSVSLLGFLILVGCDGQASPRSGSPVPMSPRDLQRVVAQVQSHRQEILRQEKRVEHVEASVEALRRKLIDERFSTLDQFARQKRWARRPPKKNHKNFKEYQEWFFLREKKEQLKLPKSIHKKVTPMRIPARVEVAPVRNPPKVRVDPVAKKFTPDWVTK